MQALDLVVLGAWVLFWGYWLIAAGGVKAARHRWGRLVGVRAVLVIVALLVVRMKAFKGAPTNHDLWLSAAGITLVALGLTLAVWARRLLGDNWGMPMSEKVDPDLVTAGPYGRIRHPIYSGIILATVGTAVAVGWYWLLATALLGGYFVYSAFMEERYMVTRFPETYPAYQRMTKMLVPFLL